MMKTYAFTWPDTRPQAIAVLASISEAAGRKVFAEDKIADIPMDSLEWLEVLVELGIDLDGEVKTVEDVIQLVVSQC